mgnify:FL=1
MPEHDSTDSNSFRKRFDFFIFIGLMISATMFITVAALQRSKSEAWENFLEGKEYSLPGYLIVDVTDLLIPEGDYNAIGPLPEGSGAIMFEEMKLEISEGEAAEGMSIEIEERLGELKKEYLDGDDSDFESAESSENIKFQEAAPDYRIHEVQQGETLATIVKGYAEYGISVEDIAKANQISNIHKLNIGDVLLIPTSKEKVEVVLKELLSRRAKAEEEAKKASKIETHTYVVQEGDNLWSIANKVNLDINTLFGCNDLKNPDVLKPGTKLRIPNQDGIFYKVAKGDTLSEIAKKYGIYAEAIVSANSIDGATTLVAGSEIFLPGAKELNISSRSTAAGDHSASASFRWPLRGRLTSRFGYRTDPITRRRDLHTGLDISSPRGTRIVASAAGHVVYAGWMGGYGRTVVIDHGRGYKTLYGHCSSIAVKRGQRVSAGQVIARVGSTGRATGPHLHFEVRKGNVPVNPLKYLR